MSPTLTVFIAASLVLAVTPGPGVIFLITRTLGQGRKIGLASVAGVAIGNFGNALIASLGLAAIFAASSRAFLFVKLAGAAYLVWLGLRTLTSPSPAATVAASPRPASRRDAFRDGFLVALLNPKTALFFAAFLPQFIGSSDSPLARSVMLGGVFVLIAVCTDMIYVLAAGAIGPRFGKLFGRSFGRYVAGTTFIALGLTMALTGSNRPHAVQGVR